MHALFLWSPTRAKERLQEFGGTAGEDSAANFHQMIQLRVIQHPEHRMDRAAFRIVRAVHQPLQPRMHQGASTHRTGLNRDKQFAVFQAIISKRVPRFAQGDHLGVRGGIGVGEVAIPSSSHDAAGAHYNGAHGHVSGFECTLGGAESFLHE